MWLLVKHDYFSLHGMGSLCFSLLCGTTKRLQAVMRTNDQKMSLFVAWENEPTLNAAEQSTGLSMHQSTWVPVFPSLTSSQRTDPPAFCATASCPVAPPSRALPIQILKSGPAKREKNVFDWFSLSSHHQLGHRFEQKSDKMHIALKTPI